MELRHGPEIGVLCGVLAASVTVHADFVGIEAEQDVLALDGVTPLANLPTYEGQAVWNVFAVFSDPDDQCLGVVGSPTHPFNVYTAGGSGFVNTSFANDTAPLRFLAELIPELNFDSFMTIGLKTHGPGGDLGGIDDAIIVAPGTPPPDGDPWGGGNTNMGWTVPPTVDGTADGPLTPQSVAGNFPDNRVLLMRLVVPPSSSVFGEFGLLVFSGVTTEVAGEFHHEDDPCVFPGSDCNGNGFDDLCDIAMGISQDANGNGIPDECECLFDIADPPDGQVNVLDLVQVVLEWGQPGGHADVNGDGAVNVQDLVLVIQNWGACP